MRFEYYSQASSAQAEVILKTGKLLHVSRRPQL